MVSIEINQLTNQKQRSKMKTITNEQVETVKELLSDMWESIELAEGVEENMPFSFDDYGKMLATDSLIRQLGQMNDDTTWTVPNKVVELLEELGI
jgi:hypothetical protein